jgi:hypothetical protein
MVGLSLQAWNWFFFTLNLVLANIAMASFFRIVALAGAYTHPLFGST